MGWRWWDENFDEDGWRRMGLRLLEENGIKMVGGGWRWLKEIRMKISGGEWDAYGGGEGEEYSWSIMGWRWWRRRGWR
jgi:hypothetical protein